MKTFKIWLLYTNNSFKRTLVDRLSAVLLLLGKFLRIGLFLLFLFFLFQGTKSIGGYGRNQIIFFYLTFNLIDTLSQLFFREVYRFRDLVVSGNLDHVLVKPVNPLIRVLFGGTDILDLFMLIMITLSVVWFGINNITQHPLSWFLYVLFILNSLLVASSIHIFILGLGVITTSIDHLIMTYRDFSSMLRIPVDLYIEPLRSLLTFIIPLGIMITFPAKVLMDLLRPEYIVASFTITLVLLFLSLWFWKFSLRMYSSASS